MIGTKSQTLSLHLESAQIEADPYFFKVLLNRALHNATKFGLTNSEIKINTKINGAMTHIEVQNQGPHISTQIMDKILKPFTLDENVMNHSVGMGLGLTICQTLLKAHGGNLEIENHESGVTVRFVLPTVRNMI